MHARSAYKRCCCCDGKAYGHQWWNRDTGFGLCLSCAERQLKACQDEGDVEEFLRSHGTAGKHWGADDATRAARLVAEAWERIDASDYEQWMDERYRAGEIDKDGDPLRGTDGE